MAEPWEIEGLRRLALSPLIHAEAGTQAFFVLPEGADPIGAASNWAPLGPRFRGDEWRFFLCVSVFQKDLG